MKIFRFLQFSWHISTLIQKKVVICRGCMKPPPPLSILPLKGVDSTEGVNRQVLALTFSKISLYVLHQKDYNCCNEPFAASSFKDFMLRHAWLNLWQKHIIHSAETLVAPFALSIAWLHKRNSICFCFLLPFIDWEAYILEKYDQYEILLNFIDKQMIFLSFLFVLNRFIFRYLSVIHRTVFPFPIFLDRKFGFHR